MLFLASTLIASSEVTPEQILLLAKKNLCFNFLRAPSPDVRKYTWRCEVEHNTLNLKREIIKTRPFMLIETFLFEHRIEHRVISYEGDQVIEYERTGPNEHPSFSSPSFVELDGLLLGWRCRSGHDLGCHGVHSC